MVVCTVLLWLKHACICCSYIRMLPVHGPNISMLKVFATFCHFVGRAQPCVMSSCLLQ